MLVLQKTKKKSKKQKKEKNKNDKKKTWAKTQKLFHPFIECHCIWHDSIVNLSGLLWFIKMRINNYNIFVNTLNVS